MIMSNKQFRDDLINNPIFSFLVKSNGGADLNMMASLFKNKELKSEEDLKKKGRSAEKSYPLSPGSLNHPDLLRPQDKFFDRKGSEKLSDILRTQE